MNHIQYLRTVVIVCAAVPFAMLLWDASAGRLGANAVNEALHITGLLSLIGLCLTLLMTPLQWLTRWGGWIAFRRAFGLYSFLYAVLHLAIYVIWDRALNLGGTFHEIWSRTFLQVGAAALLLMAPLALTSTNDMIRRMGSKQWKLLHRLVYVVAVLAALHYYMLVKSDVRQPLVFAGVIAGLLAVRIGKRFSKSPHAARTKMTTSAQLAGDSVRTLEPTVERHSAAPDGRAPSKVFDNVGAVTRARTPWKGALRIAAIIQETHDVKTFKLASLDDGPIPFDYLPGQFLNIQLMIDDKRVNRSYTLASSPTRKSACELTIKRNPFGLASVYMHDSVKVGDVVNVTGPAGKFVFTGEREKSVLLIAGGVGITPVMSIARYLTDQFWPGDIYFIYVGKTEDDLIFRDELAELTRRFSNLKLFATLTRGGNHAPWDGGRGRLTALMLQQFAPHVAQLPVYLCGPNEMMDAARELLVNLGVPTTRIHTEAFGKKSTDSKPDGKMNTAVDATSTTVNARANDQGNAPDELLADVVANGMPNAVNSLTNISFARSGLQTAIVSDATVLETAESIGLELAYECRSGFCGQCKLRLLEGSVRMECEDALSAQEKARGVILACQAKAQSSLVVDA